MNNIDYTKYPLRGLKILRKNNRKKRKDPIYQMLLRRADDIIKKRQAQPRRTFAPTYINRAAHRRFMASQD